MTPYKDFRPTSFDSKGLGLDDRQDWLVVNVGHNRDSDVLTESNWAMTLEALGGESETVEVHRFGHWGPGWFEVILVAPGSDAEREAAGIEAALADYPVLSDDDLTERAQAAADEYWAHCGHKERVRYYERYSSEFEFRCFSDMLGCLRGRYFAGDALHLVGS